MYHFLSHLDLTKKKEKGDDESSQGPGCPNQEGLKRELEMDQHKIPIEELFKRYGTNLETGLTDEQAKVRIEENGKNELTPPPQTPEWVKFCKQLFSGFALLLWVGGILCFIAFAVQSFQNPDDTPYDNLYLGIVLVAVVCVTGVFSYYQESKSAKIMESFKDLVPQTAVVRRNGEKIDIEAVNLTLGDIIEVKVSKGSFDIFNFSFGE